MMSQNANLSGKKIRLFVPSVLCAIPFLNAYLKSRFFKQFFIDDPDSIGTLMRPLEEKQLPDRTGCYFVHLLQMVCVLWDYPYSS
jgi:hypothetical protein